MKYFIILSILIPSFSFADCKTEENNNQIVEAMVITTDVPKYLEGATITVTLKDGRSSSVPANLFKVVPRMQQQLVTKVLSEKNTVCTIESEQLKNRVSLLAGNGRTSGLSTSQNGNLLEVETKTGLVGGLQYQHDLSKRIHIGAQGQTNTTFSIMGGFNF